MLGYWLFCLTKGDFCGKHATSSGFTDLGVHPWPINGSIGAGLHADLDLECGM